MHNIPTPVIIVIFVIIILIFFINGINNDKKYNKCINSVKSYLKKINSDKHHLRKIYRENYMGKDAKKDYPKISESLLIAHLKKSKCDYDKFKNRVTLKRIVIHGTKKLTEIIKQEHEATKEFEENLRDFLKY